jgi:DtxR family transcriptional regulator, Mn-dependent transcriptional regulator
MTTFRRSESVEEYLEAMYKLRAEASGITVGRLAARLCVAPPSVSQMMRRMADEGLVARGESGAVMLTEQGLREAARSVRRHRLSERLLSDLLDVPWDRVHPEACRLEHALSPEVEQRLAERLGNPSTCPHGYAIPDEDGGVTESPTKPLVELSAGDHAVIDHVSEDDADLLRYLASLGLMPQAVVSVESVAPFGGPHLIRVGSSQYAVGREVAQRVFVRA